MYSPHCYLQMASSTVCSCDSQSIAVLSLVIFAFELFATSLDFCGISVLFVFLVLWFLSLFVSGPLLSSFWVHLDAALLSPLEQLGWICMTVFDFLRQDLGLTWFSGLPQDQLGCEEICFRGPSSFGYHQSPLSTSGSHQFRVAAAPPSILYHLLQF